jgi:ribonuclease-3
LSSLKKLLDYEFMGTDTFVRSITHRSYGGKHNERLEFLGDSVLGVVITTKLYQTLPNAHEGYLSRLRASLVNEGTLAEIAVELSLGDFLKLGPGELRAGGFRRKSILADTLEAVIAGIYLEKGIEAASDFILTIYGNRFENLPLEHALKDPKSRLQELLQANGHGLPVYKKTGVSGEAHRQTFTAECFVEVLGVRTQGSGSSRRKAEQNAAQAAYEKVNELFKKQK